MTDCCRKAVLAERMGVRKALRAEMRDWGTAAEAAINPHERDEAHASEVTIDFALLRVQWMWKEADRKARNGNGGKRGK